MSVVVQYFCNVLGPTGQTEARYLLRGYIRSRSGTAFKLHQSSPLWELTVGSKVKFWRIKMSPSSLGFLFPSHKVLLTQSAAARVLLCCGIRFLELEVWAVPGPGGVERSLVNELPCTSLHGMSLGTFLQL